VPLPTRSTVPCRRLWQAREGTSIGIVLKFLTLLLFIALGVVGCDVQHGRFVTTNDTSNELLLPVGSVDIVNGYETEAPNANDHPLLYVIFITSASQEHGSGGNSDYGAYNTTLSHTWDTEKGVLQASVSWDRRSDTVTIGKSEFIRSKGNVFIARLNANGEISGKQLVNLTSPSNLKEILHFIQQQLPNDSQIASLKF
jgi:hypothetical protein